MKNPRQNTKSTKYTRARSASFRRRVKDRNWRATVFPTPWGWMGIAETARGIAAIVLPKSSKKTVQSDLQKVSREICMTAESPRLRLARKQLTEYLTGDRSAFHLPFDMSGGTEFQRRVWTALRAVPYGQVRSYRGLAACVGGRRYARAVGNAVGANPLPIVIPCHRIVAHDGSLGGFSCGLRAKRRLLAHEGSLSQLRRGDGNS